MVDLAAHLHAGSYESTGDLREQTVLRDQTCVFPRCTRPASGCDHEHCVPWPQGQTCSENQAPMCRRHHRHKTHLGWSYETLTPGVYLWTSPHGLKTLRMPEGTFDVSEPPPVGTRPATPDVLHRATTQTTTGLDEHPGTTRPGSTTGPTTRRHPATLLTPAAAAPPQHHRDGATGTPTGVRDTARAPSSTTSLGCPSCGGGPRRDEQGRQAILMCGRCERTNTSSGTGRPTW